MFGATSRGAARCNAATIYTLIHPFVPWMERTSGIDVTPAHDADGRRNPAPPVATSRLNPEATNGAWTRHVQQRDQGPPGDLWRALRRRGVPVPQIARTLGVTPVTVRWHLMRARREMAQVLGEES